MKIDFSWSLEDWKAVFNKLLILVSNFFASLGIKLFPDSPEYNSDWDSLYETTAPKTTAEE